MEGSTWNSKITKGLLLGPTSLFPTEVIAFHIHRVNMPVCRQYTSVLAWQSVTLQVLHTFIFPVKTATTAMLSKKHKATSRYTRGPPKHHILYKLYYEMFFTKSSKNPCASLRMYSIQNTLHRGLYLI